MHAEFVDECNMKVTNTVEEHLKKHSKPNLSFEKKVKLVFEKCDFLKEIDDIFEHCDFLPNIDLYSFDIDFSRKHFD